MTTPAETQRRFAQLYNEVHAIYGMVTPIGETQRQHGERLTALDRDMSKVRAAQVRQGVRLDQIEVDLSGVNERLDAVDGRFERVEDRMTIVEEKLDRQDRKLDAHSAKFDEHGAKLDEHSVKLDEHSSKLDQILDLLRPGRAETP